MNSIQSVFLSSFSSSPSFSPILFVCLFSPPPNESLTAYGLLEFNDMSQVYPVDKELIPRVQEWLMSRRSPQGGFLRGSGRYGFGNAPEDITNAYICWALTEGTSTNSNQRERRTWIFPLIGEWKRLIWFDFVSSYTLSSQREFCCWEFDQANRSYCQSSWGKQGKERYYLKQREIELCCSYTFR